MCVSIAHSCYTHKYYVSNKAIPFGTSIRIVIVFCVGGSKGSTVL